MWKRFHELTGIAVEKKSSHGTHRICLKQITDRLILEKPERNGTIKPIEKGFRTFIKKTIDENAFDGQKRL